jgi:hypothetical protein
MYYLYVVGDKFVKVKDFAILGLTKDINKASSWSDKKRAKTWGKYILDDYPKAELKEAKLTIV